MSYPVKKALFILYVADQVRSRDFYTALLDVDATLDVPGMTEFPLCQESALGLMPESGIVRLLEGAIPDPASAAGVPRAELYLIVDDVEISFNRALAAGATQVSPPSTRDWGDLAGYCLDPDGHVVALAQPTTGLGKAKLKE